MDSNVSVDKADIVNWFKSLQDDICNSLEALDEKGRFHQDLWNREGGGGGRTRIIKGQHIEKGGVNFSEVHGDMPEIMAKKLDIPHGEFLATGVSIVLHPKNPWVPIIHMNVRYFELNDSVWWFGGGIDVTPHFVNVKEATFLHHHLKSKCDRFSDQAYQEYKKWADDYFFLPHRNQTRGIGGIFFDKLGGREGRDKTDIWKFVKDIGSSFIPVYSHLFKLNYLKKYTPEEEKWQKIRRGRYVEFNLIYDRGTKFGLETSGRIESILMSLPPEANWEYNHQTKPDSLENKTQDLLRKGIDWINYKEA
ncbi:MAG: oxygen-dependent coproporphyrinogen oxidase [Saprospiraceae bacterium]